MNKRLYFDTAATTPIHPEVLSVIIQTMTETYGNPSSLHTVGQKARQILTDSRYTAARHINCIPEEIIFTSGACEANALAINGYMNCHAQTTLITTKIEHKSITDLCEEETHHIKYVPVDRYGCVDLKELERLCFEERSCGTRHLLVSIQAANSEIGTIQDISAIANIVHRYNGVFHTDATQLFPYKKIDVQSLGIDMLSISGQKINAPKGIGFLYIKNGIYIKPLIYGSQMEHRRGGTENIPYIAGLSKAIELLDYPNDTLLQMRDYLISELKNLNCDYRINGSLNHRLPNNINISFKDINGEALSILLDYSGICISTASACSSSSRKPSYVLEAIQVPDSYIYGTIRVTLPKNVSKAELDYFLNKLNISIAQFRAIHP